MDEPRIPIVILGGSDLRRGELPELGATKHALAAYKGAALHVDGRPIVEILRDRLERSGAFGPVYVTGPAHAYRDLRHGAELIDSDGNLGENLRASIDHVRPRHPDSPIAFLTCDVLPTAESLAALAARYREDAPCALWFPLVRSPSDPDRLGESDWKPTYGILPDPGATPVDVLPGHLVITRPDAMRLRFAYRLIQLGYRSRNRSIASRRVTLVLGVLAILLGADLRTLVRLRLPMLTWSVLSSALWGASKLRTRTLVLEDLEEVVGRVFVRFRHLRDHPDRGAKMPIVDELALAIDIDTEEEAVEHGMRVIDRAHPG